MKGKETIESTSFGSGGDELAVYVKEDWAAGGEAGRWESILRGLRGEREGLHGMNGGTVRR